jgi:molybdenum cofactor synthesis domain-containing protein
MSLAIEAGARTAAVLTVSDSVVAGSRQDGSGPAVAEALEKAGYQVVTREAVPDERNHIENALVQLCEQARLVVTTGGTGVATRDVTPEATLSICDREVPGIGERMRAEGIKQTPLAALSRGLCATRGSSLVLNLPGSPRGATESLAAVIDILPHALDLLAGKTAHGPSK